MTELNYPSGLNPTERGMQLAVLRDAMGPVAVHRFRDVDVLGIASDSREVRAGSLFFAVPGTLDDGARYVADAVTRGAVAVVAEREMTLPVPVLVVNDARRALATAACTFHDHPSRQLDVVAVTGTNGKTTVCHLLRHVLQTDDRAVGLLGTIGYEFGGRRLPATHTTPDAVHLQGYLREMVGRRAQACVMEASSHALVQERIYGTRLKAGVFLNLTQDHLDYHGTMHRYASAKAKLFEQLGTGSVAVLNADSSASARMLEALPPGVRVVRFGRYSEDADVRAVDIRSDADGSSMELLMPHGSVRVRLPLPGEHNVDNALAAAAAALALGATELTIAHALETAPPVRGRMELVGTRPAVQRRDRVRVFVDYAHTPDALDKVCATLRESVGRSLTVVFGCGGDRDRSKRAPMARAAARHATRVVMTSDNPRNEDPEAILDEVAAGLDDRPNEWPLCDALRCADRAAAIELAIREARPGSVVLIAGKGHETYQVLGDSVVPFDDREVAQRVLDDMASGPSESGGTADGGGKVGGGWASAG